ncbi:MAG: MFS transporter [Candidatus Hodarchaeales archaeon]
MVINKYLGTSDLSHHVKSLFRTFLFIQLINSFLMSMSATFYILNAIDHLGFTLAGVLTSVLLLTQLLLDYPSGSLGDYIGQRWLLAVSYGCYGIGFFVLSIAHDFPGFLVAAIINGIGYAQSSGTLNTWLDSNYQRVSANDSERKIYGYARSRVNTINNLSLAASFMIGGLLATFLSRQTVFFIQFIMAEVMIVIVLRYVKDIQTDKSDLITPSIGSHKSQKSYFNYIKGGIRFTFSSKTTFLFLLGVAFFNVTFTIWGNLVLFPLYFGYTGTDVGASLIRSVIFLNGIPIGLYVAKLSKKFSTHSYPRFLLLFMFTYFPAYIVLLTINPIGNSFNLFGFLSTIIIMNITTGFIMRTAEILRMRYMVDLVPNENRNSVYSLIPTITSFIAIPILPITGRFIDQYGLIAGVLIAYGFYMVTVFLFTVAMKTKKLPLEEIQERHSKTSQKSTNIG